MAAKRSRDARRMKENQIALRAGFLEKEVSNRRIRSEKCIRNGVVFSFVLSPFYLL